LKAGETVELIHDVEIKEAVDETQATKAVKTREADLNMRASVDASHICVPRWYALKSTGLILPWDWNPRPKCRDSSQGRKASLHKGE